MAGQRGMKRWLNLVGGVLGLVALGYVVQRLFQYAGQIDVDRLRVGGWSVVALLSLLYGAANVLLALAWRRLLALFDVPVGRAWAIGVYGASQLAKYVPGNVFQFAGRQALGMAQGIAGRPLAKSTLWELGLIAVAGAAFSLLALPLAWPSVRQPVAGLAFVCVAVLVAYVLRRSLSVHAAAAWCLHLVFLAASGAVFVAVLVLVISPYQALPPLPAVAGAYVAAWLTGLVVPGAPAGVGVREAVLMFALGPSMAPGDLLLVILIGRMITVLGDLIYFLSSLKFFSSSSR